jgi:WD40 repeat protein
MTRYDGFISYSHAADGKLAPAIQSSLHALGRPWYKLRALSIFRDKSSLAADPGLWPSIERALSNSRWFIYLASPKAAQSEWVGREITWWLANRDSASMLLVLTDGTIGWDRTRNEFDSNSTNVLPTALVSKFPAEPLWVNLCWAKNVNNLSLRNANFRDAILDIAAPLHGQPKDELDGDDVRQYRRNRRTAAAAIVVLLVLTIGVSITAYLALKQSRLASSRELAMYAIAQLDKDPELSLRLAIHALERAETLQAETALRAALTESRHLYTVNLDQVWWTRYSPDGRVLAVRSVQQMAFVDPATGAIQHLVSMQSTAPSCLAFSPDSHLLADGNRDGKVDILEVASGKSLRTIDVADADVKNVDFSPNGEFLITRHFLRIDGGPDDPEMESDSAVARIWRVATGELVSEMNHGGILKEASFDSTGDHILTAGNDGKVKIWDAKRGSLLKTLAGHSGEVLAARFLQDNQLVVTVDEGLTVRRWDAGTGALIVSSGKPQMPVSFVDATGRDAVISPRGSRALLRTRTSLTVVDTTTGKKTRDLGDDGSTVLTAVFSNDDRLLALDGGNSSAIVWDLDTGNVVARLKGSQNGISDLTFSLDAKILVTGATDGTARAWDIGGQRDQVISHGDEVTKVLWDNAGVQLASGGSADSVFVHDINGKRIATLNAKGRVSALSFSGDGRRLLVARYDNGGAHIWDLSSGTKLVTFRGNNEPHEVLKFADFSPDEKLVLAESGGSVLRWDAQTGERLSDLPGVPPAKLADDDTKANFGQVLRGYNRMTGMACIATEDPTVSRVWEVKTGKMIGELRGHLSPAMIAGTSFDGRWVAMWNGSRIEIWSLVSGKREAVIESGWIMSLDFSLDGTRLVSTGGRQFGDVGPPAAQIWDVKTGKLVRELRGHADTVQHARFSPDGRRLVTASADATVKVWFADTGQIITTFANHRAMVFDALLSPDGNRILTASADRTAKVLDCRFCFSLNKIRELAMQHPPRALTEEERTEFLHEDSTSSAPANGN